MEVPLSAVKPLIKEADEVLALRERHAAADATVWGEGADHVEGQPPECADCKMRIRGHVVTRGRRSYHVGCAQADAR